MRRNRLTKTRAKWLAPIACAGALAIAAMSTSGAASGAVNWSNVTSAKAGGGHRRAGRGRQEGGDAQPHRGPVQLDKLRRDHLDLLEEVRHQGQRREQARDEPAGDHRAPDARLAEPRAGRRRRRPVLRARQRVAVRAVQGAGVEHDPGRQQGRQRDLGQRLRRIRLDRLQHLDRQGLPDVVR